MKQWLIENKNGLIRSIFTLPILAVMIVSISHVVSWYELGNPIFWAIFLSVAVEIGAMASLAAGAVKIKGNVWAVFIVVTLIQFIGNIFYEYKTIDITSYEFQQWVELVTPIMEAIGTEATDLISHKRWLALLQGGLLPVISLLSLHFFVKYDGSDNNPTEQLDKPIEEKKPIRDDSFGDEPIVEKKTEVEKVSPVIIEEIEDLSVEEPVIEEIIGPVEVIEEPEEEPNIPEESEVKPESIEVIEEEVKSVDAQSITVTNTPEQSTTVKHKTSTPIVLEDKSESEKIQREDIKEVKEMEAKKAQQTPPPPQPPVSNRGFSKPIPPPNNNIERIE